MDKLQISPFLLLLNKMIHLNIATLNNVKHQIQFFALCIANVCVSNLSFQIFALCTLHFYGETQRLKVNVVFRETLIRDFHQFLMVETCSWFFTSFLQWPTDLAVFYIASLNS